MPVEDQLIKVRLENIVPNRFQPRLSFDEKALNDLANSIKQHGVIQPLVLRKVGDKFEIIAGERRFKASSMVGLKEVPAIIVEMDDRRSAEVALVENIQRKDLNPIEEAKSYQRILDMEDLTQEQLAAKMGKAQSTVANKLRLLNLDEEIQDALMNNRISERHARSLLVVKEASQQKEILRRIIENRLTVRQTEDLIKSWTKEENGENGGGTSMNNNIDSVPITSLEGATPPELNNLNENIPSVEGQPDSNQTIGNQLVFESLNNDLEKTGVLDVNEIRRAAEDINKPHEAPNIDLLLKTESGNTAPSPQTQAKPKPKLSISGRFFPSLEDETTDMNSGNDIVGSGESNFPSFNNLIPEEPKEEVASAPVDRLLESPTIPGLDNIPINPVEPFDLSGLQMPEPVNNNIPIPTEEMAFNIPSEPVNNIPPIEIPAFDLNPAPTVTENVPPQDLTFNLSPEPVADVVSAMPVTNEEQNHVNTFSEFNLPNNIENKQPLMEPASFELPASQPEQPITPPPAEEIIFPNIQQEIPVETIPKEQIVIEQPNNNIMPQEQIYEQLEPTPPVSQPKPTPQAFEYPTLDLSPEEQEQIQTRKEGSNMCKYVIQQTRGFFDKLEREGYRFEVDEYDLVNTYQITISIPK